MGKLNYLLSHSIRHSINAIHDRIVGRYRLLHVAREPRFVEIESTNRCNMQCVHCTRTNHFLKGKKMMSEGSLSFDSFLKIIGQFHFLDHVTLQGLGEPLLNPDIFRIIAHLKQGGVSVGLATNGSVLNEKVSRQLMEAGIDSNDGIAFSLDSLEAQTFEKIRPPVRFAGVLENVQRFMRLYGERLSVTAHLVVTNENIGQFGDYIRKARELGIRRVTFTDQNLDMAGDALPELRIKDSEKLRTSMDAAAEAARTAGIQFSYYKLDDSVWPRQETLHPCWSVWTYPYITWDGFVTPCCARPYPAEINFGNVFQQEFIRIWNNEQYRQFRADLRSGNIPSVCRGCPHSRFE